MEPRIQASIGARVCEQVFCITISVVLGSARKPPEHGHGFQLPPFIGWLYADGATKYPEPGGAFRNAPTEIYARGVTFPGPGAHRPGCRSRSPQQTFGAGDWCGVEVLNIIIGNMTCQVCGGTRSKQISSSGRRLGQSLSLNKVVASSEEPNVII